MRRLIGERGFTIVEVMVAVTILLAGTLGTLAMLDTANQRSRTAGDRQKATSVAREVLEVAKGVPYREITQATIVARLRQDDSIAGVSASPWRIERDGTPYTVETEVCWLDEPADGLGSRTGGGFCAGSGTGGTADTNPVDFKRVTVKVSWQNGSGGGSVRQSTLVTVRGGADAPAIASIRMTSPTAQPIISSATTSASFAVATASNADYVVWTVDGQQRGTAQGSGVNWTFSWQLPDEDGTYLIGAQAVESAGTPGEPSSATVVLNRFVPRAPTGVKAGRNGSVVDIEWLANSDRDIIGYQVYRSAAGGPASVVCSLATATSCVDRSPPTSTTGTLDYWVVAFDRDAQDNPRAGEPSVRVDVNGQNRPPNPPTALTLAKDADGDTVLQWQPPAVPDPDAGDSIAYFRIYRDGTDAGSRFGRAGATETSFVDTKTGGSTHTYWVTAVDTHLAESTFVGPVSG